MPKLSSLFLRDADTRSHVWIQWSSHHPDPRDVLLSLLAPSRLGVPNARAFILRTPKFVRSFDLYHASSPDGWSRFLLTTSPLRGLALRESCHPILRSYTYKVLTGDVPHVRSPTPVWPTSVTIGKSRIAILQSTNLSLPESPISRFLMDKIPMAPDPLPPILQMDGLDSFSGFVTSSVSTLCPLDSRNSDC
jgi:hypothetical protein